MKSANPRNIREKRSPRNGELREVLHEVVNVDHIHVDLLDSEFFGSRAVLQLLQASLLVQKVLYLPKNHESAF